jgi:AcrR family transcriptional regulator
MKQTKTATQQRKATGIRRREIVEATIRILANAGPRNFTAQRVADDVGITSGAVFRHFQSMAGIIDQVVVHVGAILAEDFPTGVADPLERLRLFFLNRTGTIVNHPDIARLLLTDHLAQAGGDTSGDRLGTFKKRSRTFVVQCLSEAQQEGKLSSGVRLEPAALVVLGAVLALSHTGTRSVRGAETERLANEVWGTLEGLFGKKAATKRAKHKE